MAIELTFDDIKQATGAAAQTAQAVRAVAEPETDGGDGFISILNRIENTLQLFNQIIVNYQNLKENISGNKESAAARPNVNTFQFAPDRQPPVEAIRSKPVREVETMPIEQMLKAKLVQFLKAYSDLGFSEVTIENLYNEFKHLTVANLIDILDGKADVAKPDK